MSTCVLWPGSTDRLGYGAKTKNGVHGAHRLAWIERYGNIPDGMFVLHRCNIKGCINPEHLYLGNQQRNMRDARDDGLLGSAKLDWEKVASIREKRRTGALLIELAAEFGVDQSTIGRVCRNETWSV